MPRQIVKGFLNRAAVALNVTEDPTLNINADDLDESMISYAPQGTASDMLPTATGVIASPVPFMAITISFKLVKTSAVCQRYLAKLGSSTFFGPCVLTPDASNLPKITVQNVMMATQESTTFSGKEPAIGFTLQGYIAINNDLFGV